MNIIEHRTRRDMRELARGRIGNPVVHLTSSRTTALLDDTGLSLCPSQGEGPAHHVGAISRAQVATLRTAMVLDWDVAHTLVAVQSRRSVAQAPLESMADALDLLDLGVTGHVSARFEGREVVADADGLRARHQSMGCHMVARPVTVERAMAWLSHGAGEMAAELDVKSLLACLDERLTVTQLTICAPWSSEDEVLRLSSHGWMSVGHAGGMRSGTEAVHAALGMLGDEALSGPNPYREQVLAGLAEQGVVVDADTVARSPELHADRALVVQSATVRATDETPLNSGITVELAPTALTHPFGPAIEPIHHHVVLEALLEN